MASLRSALRTAVLPLLLCGSLAACSSPAPPNPCDAGDEAWAKQTVQALLGRQPHGAREVRVLVDLVRATDRRTVAQALMHGDEFEKRWADFFLDEVRVNRAGDKGFAACYGAPLNPRDDGSLARHIRQSRPEDPGAGGPYNMSDVLLSSLRLDDLTPFYRAHLMAMMARPAVFCANLTDVENDNTRRRDFGDIFGEVYTNRSIDCATCHNGEFSPTYDPDPAKNRFFQVPGHFEKALYGKSAGRPAEEFNAVFRGLGVQLNTYQLLMTNYQPGWYPWNLIPDCGSFTRPEAVGDDPAKVSAFFLRPLGAKTSIWDVERALHQGTDALRARGLVLDPKSGDVDGPMALGYLLAERIANQVWQEVFGAPLTVAHYHPRNAAQRDILQALTTRLVASGFSLRALLSEIVLHPLYNSRTPDAACGDGAYPLAAVLNPWSREEEDPARRGNGIGDQVHRANARVLLRSAAQALGWPELPEFPDYGDGLFQGNVGAFVSDGLPGFPNLSFQALLSWEDRYGACRPPLAIRHDEPKGPPQRSCKGYCGAAGDAMLMDACWCDASCELFDDCCSDFHAACVLDATPRDWIDALVDAVASWQRAHPDDAATVRDVAAALKDRLLGEPDLDAGMEASLLSSLFGAASLDTPLSQVKDWPARARAYCGVLLKSPHFLLRGLAPRDRRSEPRIVPGPSYRAECEALGKRLAGASLHCGDDGLNVSQP